MPTIPVTDLEKAVVFYRDVLGLKVLEQTPFAIRFAAGSGSQLSTYKRPPVERGQTVAVAGSVNLGGDQQHRLRGHVWAEALELAHQHPVVLGRIPASRVCHVDQVQQQASTLHVFQEPDAEPAADVRSGDQTGDIGHDE